MQDTSLFTPQVALSVLWLIELNFPNSDPLVVEAEAFYPKNFSLPDERNFQSELLKK